MRTENQWSRVPARPPAALALTLEPHGMNVSSRPSRSLTERPLQGILNNDTLPSFIRSHLLGECQFASRQALERASGHSPGLRVRTCAFPEEGAHLWVRMPLPLQSPHGLLRLGQGQT